MFTFGQILAGIVSREMLKFLWFGLVPFERRNTFNDILSMVLDEFEFGYFRRFQRGQQFPLFQSFDKERELWNHQIVLPEMSNLHRAFVCGNDVFSLYSFAIEKTALGSIRVQRPFDQSSVDDEVQSYISLSRCVHPPPTLNRTEHCTLVLCLFGVM